MLVLGLRRQSTHTALSLLLAVEWRAQGSATSGTFISLQTHLLVVSRWSQSAPGGVSAASWPGPQASPGLLWGLPLPQHLMVHWWVLGYSGVHPMPGQVEPHTHLQGWDSGQSLLGGRWLSGAISGYQNWQMWPPCLISTLRFYLTFLPHLLEDETMRLLPFDRWKD